MKELLRSNDMAQLSFIEVLLRDSGIECVVFDGHTSILEGSLGVLPRRVMVLDEDWDAARRVLRDAGQDVP
ncbi:MAG: hypothetical protein CMM78_11525 [Rhodospirillaceae bacterium]|jgi:hypothetical protein|uniref:putative signal transducing protein n=1 Tax=Hwanghaeella sp. 1Z406 TaxID=3402811 RepID=UPI000C3A0E00|nr:hypothetical protein [Rhodospirillales bacterium]MAX48831.1 hypothetical protein [Rhodospirillaceae bacterium]|tara:strand:+ start:147 stop:359 length:213 start_codon:yes stop_codon:yes gene_type:complete